VTRPHLLVVAKAPVPGKVKTRLGKQIGMAAAAELAAAALADTVIACSATYGPERCCLALEGELAGSVGPEVIGLLEGWTIFPQTGGGLAERLVHAHETAGALTGGATVQIGMDTPQVTPALLSAVGDQLSSPSTPSSSSSADAVLGPADDGGWWVLGLREPARVTAVLGVPMSAPTTGADTRRALEEAGLRVATTASLRDVDTVADADLVAALAPETRFARAWRGMAPSGS
jgi:uncharacterized protein